MPASLTLRLRPAVEGGAPRSADDIWWAMVTDLVNLRGGAGPVLPTVLRLAKELRHLSSALVKLRGKSGLAEKKRRSSAGDDDVSSGASSSSAKSREKHFDSLVVAVASTMNMFPSCMGYKRVAVFAQHALKKVVPQIVFVLPPADAEVYKNSMATLAKRLLALNRASIFTRTMQVVKDAIEPSLLEYLNSDMAEKVEAVKPSSDHDVSIKDALLSRASLERQIEAEKQAPMLVRCRQLESECKKICMLLGMLVFPFIKLCLEIRSDRATLDLRNVEEGTSKLLFRGINAVFSLVSMCDINPNLYFADDSDRMEFCESFGVCIPRLIGSDNHCTMKLHDFVKFLALFQAAVKDGRTQDGSSKALQMILNAEFKDARLLLLDKSQSKMRVSFHELFSALFKDLSVRSLELGELTEGSMYKQRQLRLKSLQTKLRVTNDELARAKKNRMNRMEKEKTRKKTLGALIRLCQRVFMDELNEKASFDISE